MKAFSVNIILDASNSAKYNRPMTTINCEKKMIFLKKNAMVQHTPSSSTGLYDVVCK